MYINHQLSRPASTDGNTFVRKYVNILMLFFPLTSFLLIPTIPGTTIVTLLAGMLTFWVFLMPANDVKLMFFREMANFVCLVLVLSIISQFINLLVTLKLPSDLVLINLKDYTKTFFRPSHVTQTMQLMVGFTIYLFVKYFADENIIKYIYFGLRLLCFYAIYEFLFYLVFHTSGDFMVNRTFGSDGKSGSLFQTINLGGLSLERMKGYTGEPSMFVFTTFPFWILSIALKRRFDSILLLGCLILTFSTTAYLGILIFMSLWMVHKKEFNLVFYGLILVAFFCFVIQLDAFKHLFDSVYNLVFAGKVGGSTASSRDRSAHLLTHLTYWSSLGFFNQIFGIGFGYVRSTDFFSTVLVNNGVIGFLLFSIFFYNKASITTSSPDINKAYKTAVIILYFILMLTVPEFAYPSLWIFCAMSYVLKDQFQKQIYGNWTDNHPIPARYPVYHN